MGRSVRVSLKDAPGILRTSPWGAPQQVDHLGEGAWFVYTAGHGGVYLAPDRMAGLPEEVRGLNVYGGGPWFEEDCEWSLVWYAFPELFDEEEYPGIGENARTTIRCNYPTVAAKLGERA